MPLTFVEADTLADGWTLQVLSAGRAIGRILRGPDGQYRFYKWGSVSAVFLPEPLLEHNDLAKLKDWLEQNLERSAL